MNSILEFVAILVLLPIGLFLSYIVTVRSPINWMTKIDDFLKNRFPITQKDGSRLFLGIIAAAVWAFYLWLIIEFLMPHLVEWFAVVFWSSN